MSDLYAAPHSVEDLRQRPLTYRALYVPDYWVEIDLLGLSIDDMIEKRMITNAARVSVERIKALKASSKRRVREPAHG